MEPMMDLCTKIQDYLVEVITQACKTEIPETDDTWVDLVQSGKYQDDPEGINTVCVHRNDPERTDEIGEGSWPDARVSEEVGMTIGMEAWEHWKRRFTVEIVVWPVGKDQNEAKAINGTVVARVRKAINHNPAVGLFDEFGESLVHGSNPIVKIKTDERGGPPDEYNWRTNLYLEYLTLMQP
jgi:hypothetical protein